MHHGEFRDPRVVALYDLAFPWSRDDDFFVAELAAEPARDVLDLGCGTGRLAIALAARGYAVTGVDPAGPSLALARRKPGAEVVTWIEGSTEVLPPDAFDAALMTSHVAQFFVTDDACTHGPGSLSEGFIDGNNMAANVNGVAVSGAGTNAKLCNNTIVRNTSSGVLFSAGATANSCQDRPRASLAATTACVTSSRFMVTSRRSLSRLRRR